MRRARTHEKETAPPDSHLKCSKLKSYFCSFSLHLSDTTLTCDNFILVAAFFFQTILFRFLFFLCIKCPLLGEIILVGVKKNTHKFHEKYSKAKEHTEEKGKMALFSRWGVLTSTSEERKKSAVIQELSISLSYVWIESVDGVNERFTKRSGNSLSFHAGY